MMRQTQLLLSILFVCTIFYAPVFSQDSLYISATSNGSVTGLVEYITQTQVPKTHLFTLFGDGHFSMQKNPKHAFQPSSTGYTTETYFVKPYLPNLPPTKSVSSGSTGSGTGFTNPAVLMPTEVKIMNSWSPAHQFEHFFIVAISNQTSLSPIRGCVDFLIDSSQVTIDTSGIKEYNNWIYNRRMFSGTFGNYNQKLQWSFDSLRYNEIRYIYIPATVYLNVGRKMSVSANYYPYCDQFRVTTTEDFLVRRYPHDPNFKIVDKDCLSEDTPEQTLEYTVGFFNDGNYFANDVFLFDHLPENLNPSTIKILDYEFPPTMNLYEDHLYLDFLGIRLPGINQTMPYAYTYEDAFSYVTFSICTVPPIHPGDCISNEVKITFDTQPPLITDPAIVCCEANCNVAVHCGEIEPDGEYRLAQEHEHFSLSAYPNPFQSYIDLSVKLPSSMETEVTLELLDHTGRTIRSLNLPASGFETFEKQFYLNDLPNGIYLIVLQSNHGTHVEKIIKQ